MSVRIPVYFTDDEVKEAKRIVTERNRIAQEKGFRKQPLEHENNYMGLLLHWAIIREYKGDGAKEGSSPYEVDKFDVWIKGKKRELKAKGINVSFIKDDYDVDILAQQLPQGVEYHIIFGFFFPPKNQITIVGSTTRPLFEENATPRKKGELMHPKGHNGHPCTHRFREDCYTLPVGMLGSVLGEEFPEETAT